MKPKKKNIVKLVLDVAMGITFALLFNKRVLGGLAFHEIAGIAIGAAVLVHILLNVKFVQKITLRIFDRSLPHRTRLSYLLNVLLLLGMGFIIVSGLFISKVVFPNLRVGNENWFKMSHMAVSYSTLVLIGIHIGLHWHWVITMLQKILPLHMPKALAKALMLGLAALVLVYGGYQIYSTQFISKLGMIRTVFQTSDSAAPGFGHGGMEGGRGGAAAGTESGKQGRSPVSSTGDDGASQSGSQSLTRQPGTGPDREGMKGGGGMPGANFLSVILTYFGIMGVFAAITYYADKWAALGRKRLRLARS